MLITGMQLAKKMSIDLDRVELSKKKFKKTKTYSAPKTRQYDDDIPF